MKNYLYNIGYFIKEGRTIVKLNLISNIFSLITTGLIFFILIMVISGWWISNEIVNLIQREAEISVYFNEGANENAVINIMEDIKKIKGIEEVRRVDKGEAYERMAEILGEDSNVLRYFDYNPFNPFIEVRINLEELDSVIEEIQLIEGIEYVRDNREVLNRIKSISEVLGTIGYLFIAGVGIATLVIISHIIRQGIYNNRELIYTLRLLGAPEGFIALPFLLVGLFLALGGGLTAGVISILTLKYLFSHIAGPLPFIPLPSITELTPNIFLLIGTFSTVLGIAGSLMGLSNEK